jgi:hypothetical protein
MPGLEPEDDAGGPDSIRVKPVLPVNAILTNVVQHAGAAMGCWKSVRAFRIGGPGLPP